MRILPVFYTLLEQAGKLMMAIKANLGDFLGILAYF
jgi:hypothetical protein